MTEGDISQRVIAQINKPIEFQVESIMSKPIICIESNKQMTAAFLVKEDHEIQQIAVSENGKITGTLSIRDYVRKFSKRKKMS